MVKNINHIIIHIGLHKTGTTTLQKNFFNERHNLYKDYGILYPGIHSNHSKIFYSLFGKNPEKYHANIKRKITSEEGARNYNNKLLYELNGEISKFPGPTLLISGEDLSSLSSESVASFKHWLENITANVDIIVCLRHPLAVTSSMVQQRVKGGALLSRLEKHPPKLSFRNRLQPWIESFGKEAIKAYDYEEARNHPQGILGHFCDVAGLPSAFYRNCTQRRTNESMSLEGVALLSALNAVRPPIKDGRLASHRFPSDAKPFIAVPGNKFQLSGPALERVKKNAVPELDWLRDTLGIALQAPSDPTQRKRLSFDKDALEHLALLISDAQNERRVEVLLQKGRRAHGEGDLDKARNRFREALRILPDSAEALDCLNRADERTFRNTCLQIRKSIIDLSRKISNGL